MNDDQNNGAGQAPTEDQEWGNAIDGFLGSKGIDNSDKGGDDDDKNAGAGANAAAGTGNNGDAAQKSAANGANAGDAAGANGEGAGTGDDDGNKDGQNEVPEYDPTIANARKTQREIAVEREAYQADVRTKLFPDLKTTLQDSEGKPISSAKDLERLVNPQTEKAFTPEEAQLFFMQAQSHLAKQNEEATRRVEQVADVLSTITDESRAAKAKWGPLLAQLDKKQPGFADGLLARYKKQLDVDSDSGLIVGFKMGPEEFYDTVLAGYEEAAKAAQNGAQSTAQVQAEKRQVEQKLEKTQRKADRSDITSGSNTDTRSSDDKEWDTAIQQQFGDKLKSKK